MQKTLLFFLMLSVSVLANGCVTGGNASLPWGMDTGVVTQDPQSIPDIAWQTQNQRQVLTRQSNAVAAESSKTMGTAERDPNRPSLQTIVAPAGPARKVSVALLLPLSGKHASLGQAMLKASQMALFDVGSANFDIVPQDTKSTPEGAAAAAQAAVGRRVDLVLGPIFAEDVRAAKPILSSANIPLIAFTTDWSMGDRNTYIFGFLPFLQVARVAQFAESQGLGRFAVYAPQTEYCDVVISSLQRSAGSLVAVERYAAEQPDLSALVADFSARHNLGAETFRFDTLMLPLGGESLRSLVALLDQNGIKPPAVKLVGTGLWDDPALSGDVALHGGWFAAPDPQLRRDFEKRYQENFGEKPVRLSSLAYDATALAAVLARTTVPGENPYDRARLTHPRGFAGIDGIFRFRGDGLAERGLAVLEIRPGGAKVVSPAPTAFVSSGS